MYTRRIRHVNEATTVKPVVFLTSIFLLSSPVLNGHLMKGTIQIYSTLNMALLVVGGGGIYSVC